MFCFVLDMIHMLPREFARLKQAGGLGGAQAPPPCANTIVALGFLNCCLNSPPKAQQVKPFRRLKLLPEPSTKGPASIRPLKLLPKSSTEGPASITPFKQLPKPSTKGPATSKYQASYTAA